MKKNQDSLLIIKSIKKVFKNWTGQKVIDQCPQKQINRSISEMKSNKKLQDFLTVINKVMMKLNKIHF
jgi:hypothetical protein